ncbi:iron ABC transporter substrate-binding protein, partial [Bacillus sp. HC-TM]
MKKSMLLKLVSILAVFTLMLVACSDSSKETSKANNKDNGSDKPKT